MFFKFSHDTGLFVCTYTIVNYKLEQYFSLILKQLAVNNPRLFTACRTGWLNPAHGHVEYSEFLASIFAWWSALSFLGHSLKAKNLSSQLLGKFWINMREVSVGLATFPSAGPLLQKRFLKKFNAIYFVSGYETSQEHGARSRELQSWS